MRHSAVMHANIIGYTILAFLVVVFPPPVQYIPSYAVHALVRGFNARFLVIVPLLLRGYWCRIFVWPNALPAASRGNYSLVFVLFFIH